MDALFSDICEKIVDKSAKNPFKTLHFIKKNVSLRKRAELPAQGGACLLDTTELGMIFSKLLLACVLGGLIGYEREARHKSAGLRTNILVCLGSCLVMMISVGFQEWTNADAARIAAQVVSGIGFLGAGAIMKEGLSVTGLTTAACLCSPSPSSRKTGPALFNRLQTF